MKILFFDLATDKDFIALKIAQISQKSLEKIANALSIAHPMIMQKNLVAIHKGRPADPGEGVSAESVRSIVICV